MRKEFIVLNMVCVAMLHTRSDCVSAYAKEIGLSFLQDAALASVPSLVSHILPPGQVSSSLQSLIQIKMLKDRVHTILDSKQHYGLRLFNAASVLHQLNQAQTIVPSSAGNTDARLPALTHAQLMQKRALAQRQQKIAHVEIMFDQVEGELQAFNRKKEMGVLTHDEEKLAYAGLLDKAANCIATIHR